jgi:hypothetical protein
MAPLIVLILSMGILAAFGYASFLWGVDSRPSIGDDHAR